MTESSTSSRKAPAGAGIRVCARFRPQNKLELKQQAVEVVRIEEATTVRIGGADAGGSGPGHTFTFDQVFGTRSTQAEVYAATAKPLVEAALGGYNCTCFVYGQTGTGKTFSMEGVPGDPEYAGIIPRVMDDVFGGIANMQAELEFIVRVSYIEIYLEKIRDLLEPASNNLSVRESRERGVWVAGATEVCCASAEEMMAVMRLGGANRVISSTRMNNDSSRSHSVFIITIEQRNVATGSTKSGKLFLVDLAGSEKVGKTHAKGQTLKEAQHINKSLSALGSVMNALTSGQSNAHVPYRDSKLTRLLQDSLGGNSETTLLVCGSCSSYNAEETLSTLRFGSRAKSIKNKPKVNEERTVSEYKQLLLEKEQVIAALQAQLQKVADTSATPRAQQDAPVDSKQVQDLTSQIEQMEDDLASKTSEIATLEERVMELETKQKAWQGKELELTKLDQINEAWENKLTFVESALAAKSQECTDLQTLIANQSSKAGDATSVDNDGEAVGASSSSMAIELLRQQLGAKSNELQIVTGRVHSLTEELDNCRGFYERELAVLQDRVREYDSHIMGLMELAESEDKTAQLESLMQRSKALRSVRGGVGGTGDTPHATPTKQVRDALAAAAASKKESASQQEQYHRPRFVSAASTAPDGWVLDEEIFPTAPIDMDSPIVKRLIASMPEKGREKMYKWLVFVLEGRDIRANFHPEISMEGINDEISKDMRRLIIPLLKQRQDIDVESYVRTRFVKVSDLKIKLVHRHQDTMHLDSSDHDHDETASSIDSGRHRTSSSVSAPPPPSGKMWARDHLFYGPKSDPASESVLHTKRTLAANSRVDRYVSEPVDMSASLLESKNILNAPTGGLTAAASSSNSSSSLKDPSSAPGSASGKDASGPPLSGSGLGGMFNRLRARQATVGTVLGDVKNALTARYHKHHVHEDTMCDGCGVSPIIGAKWKCNTCDDFELCDACYGNGCHGCEVSHEMCRRIELLAVQRHRILGEYPELFELLRAHICDDDVIHFRQIVEWLGDIVSEKPVSQLHQKNIVKSGLHPDIRARLVIQLGALASERTDLELKTEWFVERTLDEETEDEETKQQEDATVASVRLETLRMYVKDIGSSESGTQRKLSFGESNGPSVTSEDSNGSVGTMGPRH